MKTILKPLTAGLAMACAAFLMTPAGLAQTSTKLASVVAVRGGASSNGNVVVEATIGAVGGTSAGFGGAQVQHGYVPQMRPAPPALLGPRLAGGVLLTVFGEDGVDYRVQSSTDLRLWPQAASVRTTNGAAQIVLPWSGGVSRFYRVLALQ
jgi:hypothetical protein